MAAHGKYNQWDVIQLAARAVLSHGQHITVEIDTKIALVREMTNYKFILKESVETIHPKTKIRVEDKDIKNVYDIMKAIREEVVNQERKRLLEETESLYRILWK